MKLKATIISIVSVLIIGLTAILLYCFWPAIKGTVDNSKYYTQKELQESYDKGYNDGCKTETELTGQVKYYKSLVDEYYIQVNTLNDEITMLTKTKKDYETQIANIESQKANLQIQVNNLTTIKTNNETTIASLNSQIASLQNQVTNLTNSGEDKSEQIAQLNTQISSLQNLVSQLQTTNNMNVDTITGLNVQIANLNNQISEMTLLSQNSTSQIANLNNKIAELQKSVTYYESYIAQLESGEQVVATFEYDGSVYNIQIVNKGSKLSVTTPASTEYKIFNGWKVNGETIDLSTYTISQNTKIVADVTYKYDVVFKVDNDVYNSQVIVKNGIVTLPTNPTKNGYEFDGWSKNGVDVINNVQTILITENTTYEAVFTKLHNVTFKYEDVTKSTQTIRNGNYATAPTIESTDYKVFNGWKVNGTLVNLSTYKIVADTTFVADVTYRYKVEFKVDNAVYNSQFVVVNSCATLPTNPTKTGYKFVGWSINGVDVINNIETSIVIEDITYQAVFTKLHNVTFISNGQTVNSLSVVDGNAVNVGDFAVDSSITENNVTYNFIGYSLTDNPTRSINEENEFVAYDRTLLLDINSYVPTQDVTVFAIYELHSINYILNGSFDYNINNNNINSASYYFDYDTPLVVSGYTETVSDFYIDTTVEKLDYTWTNNNKHNAYMTYQNSTIRLRYLNGHINPSGSSNYPVCRFDEILSSGGNAFLGIDFGINILTSSPKGFYLRIMPHFSRTGTVGVNYDIDINFGVSNGSIIRYYGG